LRKLQSIQYLRAVAALMVVIHHARNPRPGLFDPLAGYNALQTGVDIFFVISGFIMFTAARDERPLDFLRRRVVRVAPLYWLATLITLPFVMANHGLHLDGSLLVRLAKSFLFIPSFSPEHPGEVWPVLVVGWTLNYEMFFYAVFALGLARCLPLVVAPILLSLVALGLIFPSTNPLWTSYTSPQLLEFLAGVGLAAARERLEVRGLWLLIPVGFAGLLAHPAGFAGGLVCGAAAVMIVAGAASLDLRGAAPDLPWLRLLGDASYSIYLFQVVAIGVTAAVVMRLPIGGEARFGFLILGCTTASVGLGLLTHVCLERPLLRRFSGQRRAGGASRLADRLRHVATGPAAAS
jgi:exopolysaccharide production protein ExoZ